MIKALSKYLLPLCILLLSGFSQLLAHTYQAGTFHSFIKELKKSEFATVGPVEDSRAFINKATSSGTEKEIFKLEAAEIEEEELLSFKKYVVSSHHVTTLFYALTYEYFLHYLKNRLLSCKQFSYCSPSESLYLIFRVFRI